jgi:hypothetical protein
MLLVIETFINYCNLINLIHIHFKRFRQISIVLKEKRFNMYLCIITFLDLCRA